MKRLNKKYRCIMPYDMNDKVLKSKVNKDNVPTYDYDDALVFCYNGKIFISKMDRNTLRAVIFSLQIFNKVLENMKAEEIEIVDSYLLEGEGWIDFNYKDMDKVAPIVKAKKQRKTPVGMTRIENLSYWNRIRRWIRK